VTIDLRDHYPLHDECKKYLDSLQKSKKRPSESTINQYRKDVERMMSNGDTPKTLCTSKATYYKYRAAWSYRYREYADLILKGIEEMKLNGRISDEDKPKMVEMIAVLNEAVEQIKKYPPDYNGTNLNRAKIGEYESEWQSVKSNAPDSKSKKNQRLPKDFEDKFFNHVLKNSRKYSHAVAISMLSGCRPEELVSGVIAELQNNGSIKITIKGVKTHGKEVGYGQEKRGFCVKTDTAAFKFLREELEFSSTTVKISIESPNSFGEQVRKYGKKCFPRMKSKISPYNFRHIFSKKAKQSLSEVGVAQVLGHSTDKSQDYYSKKNHNGSGFFEISDIKSSSDIRITRTSFEEYVDNSCHKLKPNT